MSEDRFREHRIRTSLGRYVPSTEEDSGRVHGMARAAFHKRGSVLFTAEDLDAMPWGSRELILAEARKLYGVRRGDR